MFRSLLLLLLLIAVVGAQAVCVNFTNTQRPTDRIGWCGLSVQPQPFKSTIEYNVCNLANSTTQLLFELVRYKHMQQRWTHREPIDAQGCIVGETALSTPVPLDHLSTIRLLDPTRTTPIAVWGTRR